MTPDQIGGLIRTLLAIIGGIIISHGWINADGWVWVSAGIASVIPGVWSWYSNRPASIAAAAQRLIGVNVTTDATAGPAVVAAVAAAK